jgi:hypothetical protein
MSFKLGEFFGKRVISRRIEKEEFCPFTGKTRYRTKRKAKERLRKIRDDEIMNAYHCRRCGDWHIGHSDWGGKR